MNSWVKSTKRFVPLILNTFLILASAVTECISISALASLLGFPLGITSSALGLEICAITAKLKKYNLIIKRKKKKNNKIILLAKTKLNSIDV